MDNEKLALWAGFTRVPHFNFDKGKADPDWWAIGDRVSGYEGVNPPDFPHSLDATFRWLVPVALEKLKRYYRDTYCFEELMSSWALELKNGFSDHTQYAEALCLAILKIVEEKE